MSAPVPAAGKALTPPPAYSAQPDPHQHLSASGPAGSTSSSSPVSPLNFPTHAAYYGPTPIMHGTQLLPYDDPRWPHAVAEATHRARRRFIEAALWAIFILAAVSFVTGWEVEMMMRPGRHAGPRVYER